MSQTINMEAVVRELALPYEITPQGRTYTCPVCGRKGKWNITDKVYNCAHPDCDFHGSAFDLWAHFRDITAQDRKELCRLVAKDFYSYTGGGIKVQPKAPVKKTPPIRTFNAASEEVLDDTYSALLEQLTLSEKHRDALRRRGLPDEIIDANGYKTAATVGNRQIAHRLLSSGHLAEGVPGLYKTSQWTVFNYGSGFLIPCRSIDGKIHGLQQRTDQRTYRRPLKVLHLRCSAADAKRKLRPANGTLYKKAKYLTVSTGNKPYGTKGFTKPHYNPGWDAGNDLIITEGPLKGDIISMFTGKATLSVLGVSSLSFVPEMLRQLRALGKSRILIAYDMDMYAKNGVRKALRKLERIIAHMGYRYGRLDWKEEYEALGLKGYDDYLLYCFRK